MDDDCNQGNMITVVYRSHTLGSRESNVIDVQPNHVCFHTVITITSCFCMNTVYSCSHQNSCPESFISGATFCEFFCKNGSVNLNIYIFIIILHCKCFHC